MCVFLLLLAHVFLYVWRYILCHLHYYLIFLWLYQTLCACNVYFVCVICGHQGLLCPDHLCGSHAICCVCFLVFCAIFCILSAIYMFACVCFGVCVTVRRCLLVFCVCCVCPVFFLLLCICKGSVAVFSFVCTYISLHMTVI